MQLQLLRFTSFSSSDEVNPRRSSKSQPGQPQQKGEQKKEVVRDTDSGDHLAEGVKVLTADWTHPKTNPVLHLTHDWAQVDQQ